MFDQYIDTLKEKFDKLDIAEHKNVLHSLYTSETIEITKIHMEKLGEKLVEILFIINDKVGDFNKMLQLIEFIDKSGDYLNSALRSEFTSSLHSNLSCKTIKRLEMFQSNFLKPTVDNEKILARLRNTLKTLLGKCYQIHCNWKIVNYTKGWKMILNTVFHLRYIDDFMLDLYLFCIEEFNTPLYHTRIIDAKRLIRMQYEYYDRKDILRRITDLLDQVYPLRDALAKVSQAVMSKVFTSTRCTLCHDSEPFKDQTDKVKHFINADHNKRVNSEIHKEFNRRLANNSDAFDYCVLCQDIKSKGHHHHNELKYFDFDKSFCYTCEISLGRLEKDAHFSSDNPTHYNICFRDIISSRIGRLNEYYKYLNTDGLVEQLQVIESLDMPDQPLQVQDAIGIVKNHMRKYVLPNEEKRIRKLPSTNKHLRNVNEKLKEKMCEYVIKFYESKKLPENLTALSRAKDLYEDFFQSLLTPRSTKKLYCNEYRLYTNFLPDSELYKIPMSKVEYQQLQANKKKECYDKAVATIEEAFAKVSAANGKDNAIKINGLKTTILNACQSNFIPLPILPLLIKSFTRITTDF